MMPRVLGLVEILELLELVGGRLDYREFEINMGGKRTK